MKSSKATVNDLETPATAPDQLYALAVQLVGQFSETGRPKSDIEQELISTHNIPKEINGKPNPAFIGVLSMVAGYAKITGAKLGQERGADPTWHVLDQWLLDNSFKATSVSVPALVAGTSDTYTLQFTTKSFTPKPRKSKNSQTEN